MGNLYDCMEVDIAALHDRLNGDQSFRGQRFTRHGLTDRLLMRMRFYQRLVDAGIVRGWFDEFNEFWIRALGGRPLKIHDFFYLHSLYRCRFQSIEVEDNASAPDFLHAWQRFENIYLIFGAAYKYAHDPFHHLRFRQFIPRTGNVLEYGCGVAPVVTSMVQSGFDGSRCTVADIRGFTHAYAKWRLGKRGVKCIDLEPSEPAALDGSYQTIFLLTVLEHLPNPTDVVAALLDHLQPGGHLVFDYILGDGHGLDTRAGIEQRQDVLNLISEKCDTVLGSLKSNESMSTTVVRKHG